MKINHKTLYMFGGIAAAVLVVAVVLVLALGGSGGNKYEKHYDAAQSAFLKRDYQKALSELDKAMEIESTEEAYLLMADVYYAQGDTDMAIQVLYLGYSHIGSQSISNMLDRLKAEQSSETPDKTPSGSVTIGSEEFSYDTTSAVLSDRGLGNSDLQMLVVLTSLEELTLSENNISDISPLTGLTKLNSLQLSDNRISDLTPLSGLSALKTLYIDGNPITDFTPLEQLSALRTLSMKRIVISDAQLSALQEALPNCRIYCDTPVSEIPEITIGDRTVRADVTELNLAGLEIDDISVLSECTELRVLDLRDNKITDLSPLTDLIKLEQLCLWNNQVSDLLPLMGLTNLRYLDIDTNAVTDILPLAQLTSLQELWLNNNELRSIETLRGLTNLTRLGLKNVGLESEDLDALMGLTALKELSLENNEGLSQTKVDALQEALPECVISHSELTADLEEPEDPDNGAAPEITPDTAYVSVGANAAVNAAGTGSGYAILWDGNDAASAGIRAGFIAQAKSLGMNVVADLWYADADETLASHVYGARALGADVLILAANDEALSVLVKAAAEISYAPQIIQVY